jgi:hypothetical protein
VFWPRSHLQPPQLQPQRQWQATRPSTHLNNRTQQVPVAAVPAATVDSSKPPRL